MKTIELTTKETVRSLLGFIVGLIYFGTIAISVIVLFAISPWLLIIALGVAMALLEKY